MPEIECLHMTKKLLKKGFLFVFVVCLSVLISLIFSEIYLANDSKSAGDDFTNDKRRYINLREMTPSTSNKSTFEIDGELRTAKVSVDENGFIEPSIIHDDPEFTLVFLGDSTTAGNNIAAENKFPYLVGRNLEGITGRRINSINAAKSGNNAMHSNLIFLANVMKFKPDAAILMHNINDFNLLSSSGSYWSGEVGDLRLIQNFSDTRYSRDWSSFQTIKNILIPYTWNFIMTRLRPEGVVRKKAKPAPMGLPIEGWENYQITKRDEAIAKDFKRALTTFINIAKSFGVIPVLMTQPTRGPFANPALSENALFTAKRNFAMHAYLNAVIRKLGSQENVAVIDLEPLFRMQPDRSILFYDMVHLTGAGSRLIAEQATKRLLPLIQRKRSAANKVAP